jgi:hypothetical protein
MERGEGQEPVMVDWDQENWELSRQESMRKAAESLRQELFDEEPERCGCGGPLLYCSICGSLMPHFALVEEGKEPVGYWGCPWCDVLEEWPHIIDNPGLLAKVRRR